MSGNTREIIYLTDPMCSWCWGFAPVLDSIRRDFEDIVPVRMVVGGLRVGTKEIMTPQMRDFVVHHWHEVQKLTGQPFRFDFNMGDSFRYDTEPSCRAVVAVRRIDETKTFAFFHRLQRAFYLENLDLTDTDVLAQEAVAAGIELERFRQLIDDPGLKHETVEDFVFSTNLGIRGFPSVVLRDGEEYRLLTIGYRGYDVLEPRIREWLSE